MTTGPRTGYSMQKFGEALHILTTYDESLSTRLQDACNQLILVEKRHIPPEYLADWHFIQARLQGKRTSEEDSVLAGAILTMTQKLWAMGNDASFLKKRLVDDLG
jgi:hypothetical protein